MIGGSPQVAAWWFGIFMSGSDIGSFAPWFCFVLVFDSGLAVLIRLVANLSRHVGFSKLDVGCVQKRKKPAVSRLGWMGFVDDGLFGFGRPGPILGPPVGSKTKNARGAFPPRAFWPLFVSTEFTETYSSTDSTSRTKRDASFSRNDETTLNTASLKPPMFRMSSRSSAWLVP